MGCLLTKKLFLTSFSSAALIWTLLGLSLLFTFNTTSVTINTQSYVQPIQKYVVQWNTTLGGADYDWANALVQTVDGGFALAGGTWSYGAGGEDMYLVKTNGTGIVEWNTTFGETHWDEAISLVQTVDGGFALAGLTETGDDTYSTCLVKIDNTGDVEWNITFFREAIGRRGNPLVLTTDGGFALAGYTYPYGAGDSDMWLVKITSTGITEWNTTFGGAEYDSANALIQTADGGYVLAGETGWYGASSHEIFREILLLKTDSTGAVEWNRTYGGHDYFLVYSLVQTTDRGFALAGDTWSDEPKDDYMQLMKTDSTGAVEWTTTYGGPRKASASSLVQTADGGFALAGWTYSYSTGSYDMYLVKTNSTGAGKWYTTFGGDYGDWANALVQTADGGFVLAGVTTSFGSDDGDMWLVKVIEAKVEGVSGITLEVVVILVLILLYYYFILLRGRLRPIKRW